MGKNSDLDALESIAGVHSTTTDGVGVTRTASDATRCAVLRAMGYEVAVSTDGSIQNLPPILDAVRQDRANRRLPESQAAWNGLLSVDVDVTDGTPFRLSPVDEGPVSSDTRATVGTTASGKITIPDVPFGFHRLELGSGTEIDRSFVISAPPATFQPIEKPNAARWGVFAPTSSLWSSEDKTGGTVSHLEALGRWVADSGGDLVACLPMLATKPGDASPYSPLSRRFWDERILDLNALGSNNVPIDVDNPMRSPAIEHSMVTACLEALLPADPATTEGAHELTDEPAYRWAQFRAAQERYGDDWRSWPEPAKSGDLSTLNLDERVVARHLLAQSAADEQLEQLNDHLGELQVGLYLDLPIGAHPDGFDHWEYQSEFAEGVQVGAPPDALFAGGQAWGFAPSIPKRMVNNEFESVRAALEAHMRHADILRLDHVMSLERLYWLVDDATDGVYVDQPIDELFAIVCLLSHRHEVEIVGENLGTVSDRIQEALDERAVAGMHILQFDPFGVADTGSVASLNTHDLPTFAGWWNGDDLDTFEQLGLLTTEDAATAQNDRANIRRELAQAAEAEPSLGPVPESVLHQAFERLGHSPASIVLASLDDLCAERTPINVPGTVDDSNWVRRNARPLEDLNEAPEIRSLVETLDRARSESKEADAWPPPGWWFGAEDQHLFNEGSHTRLWHGLGARLATVDGIAGTRFAVWAPNARSVSVVADFNGWTRPGLRMRPVGSSGVWDVFAPHVETGTKYKYLLETASGAFTERSDPFAFQAEVAPATASIVTELHHEWGDDQWTSIRGERNRWDQPISVYEVHLGSWRPEFDDPTRPASYATLCDSLVQHVKDMGFTHVELMPITEHPLFASWGYQTTGYFAATSRYGHPTELMALIDAFHQADIGVILDWVPSHFPTDQFALANFDGTSLFEHQDPREGFHPDWKSAIFNYGRHEVQSFLLSSARFWLEAFHVDGLRVDAVASMLYRDYSRGDDWIPNIHGGRENLEAVAFLRQLNAEMYAVFPDVMTIAEESTAWPGVTKPVDEDGLGFGFKWDMGWMNDTLEYFSKDPIHRRWEHNKLTFRAMYGWSENFVLPLSHDEVVHGKGSLLAKMPGNDAEKFANLRLLLGWQYATPGKKLLFMGSELAPWTEWNHDTGLDWGLADHAPHQGCLQWIAALNDLYRNNPAMYERDTSPEGFAWVDAEDVDRSIFSLLRTSGQGSMLVVMNATPLERRGVMTGVPRHGRWNVVACSDDERFGGSGGFATDSYDSTPHHHNTYEQSLWLDLPPLSITFLRPDDEVS